MLLGSVPRFAPRSLVYTNRARAISTSTMSGRVHRVTMFKLPREEDQQKMISEYKKVWETATRDGKPYVLSLVSGPAKPDERSQGYTFVAKSEFASMDDMMYYNDDCAAHDALKVAAKEMQHAGPPLTVILEPAVVRGSAESQ